MGNGEWGMGFGESADNKERNRKTGWAAWCPSVFWLFFLKTEVIGGMSVIFFWKQSGARTSPEFVLCWYIQGNKKGCRTVPCYPPSTKHTQKTETRRYNVGRAELPRGGYLNPPTDNWEITVSIKGEGAENRRLRSETSCWEMEKGRAMFYVRGHRS